MIAGAIKALTGWRGYVVAALAGIAIVAGVLAYGRSQHQAGRDALAAEYRAAELEAWRQEAEKLAGLSAMLEDSLTILRDAEPRIIERYTRVQVEHPLPDGCRIDDGRLQHINAAVSAANAARQSGRALPADTGSPVR